MANNYYFFNIKNSLSVTVMSGYIVTDSANFVIHVYNNNIVDSSNNYVDIFANNNYQSADNIFDNKNGLTTNGLNIYIFESSFNDGYNDTVYANLFYSNNILYIYLFNIIGEVTNSIQDFIFYFTKISSIPTSSLFSNSIAFSTTIYTLPIASSIWGTSNLNTNTNFYWNSPNFYNVTPNQSNPIIYSNTYNSTSANSNASLWVMCDNICSVYLNNILIGTDGSFPNGKYYNVTLINGTNKFLFYCINLGTSNNPAGFACNLFDTSVTSLPTAITPVMLTDSLCNGWICQIGGFFSKNQPLVTLYAVGTTELTNKYMSNTGYYACFSTGMSISSSNYQVLTSDLSNLFSPCIPIISGIYNSHNNKCTITWYYIGVCNSYIIYADSNTNPTSIYDVLIAKYEKNSQKNTLNQKYIASSSSTNNVYSTGSNTYTSYTLANNVNNYFKVMYNYNPINTSDSPNSIDTSKISSIYSNVICITTIPGAPTIAASVITSTSVQIILTQNASDGPVSYSYFSITIAGTPYNSNTSYPGVTMTISSLTAVFTNLKSNTSYSNITGTITNNVGTSASSNAISITTIPGAPTIASSNITSTGVNITLTKNASDGSVSYSYFSITIAGTPYNSNTSYPGVTMTISSLTAVFTNLQSNTSYSNNIIGTITNNVGTSASSSAISITTMATVPTTQTWLVGSTVMQIGFNPTNANSYKLYYSQNNSFPGTTSTNVSTYIITYDSSFCIQISGLTANTTYYYWMAAVDRSTVINYSTTSSSITTTTNTSTYATTSNGSTEVYRVWNGSILVNYTLHKYTTSGNITTTATKPTITIGGTVYNYMIILVGGGGGGGVIGGTGSGAKAGGYGGYGGIYCSSINYLPSTQYSITVGGGGGVTSAGGPSYTTCNGVTIYAGGGGCGSNGTTYTVASANNMSGTGSSGGTGAPSSSSLSLPNASVGTRPINGIPIFTNYLSNYINYSSYGYGGSGQYYDSVNYNGPYGGNNGLVIIYYAT